MDFAKTVLPCVAILVFAMQITNGLYNRTHPHNVDQLVPKLSKAGKRRIADVIVIGILVVIVYLTVAPIQDWWAGLLVRGMTVVALAVSILGFDLFGFDLQPDNKSSLPESNDVVE